jgi:hypothetical protein
MTCGRWMILLLVIFTGFSAAGQKIVYSDPEKDDTRKMNFEIAGKVGGSFLIYKNIRNRNWIAVYDNDMKLTASVEQDYVPDNDRMINVDFFAYGDYCYMVYQYQKKNIIYCIAAKIDGQGKKIGEVTQIDTTHLGFAANNRVYSVISSEDKSKLAVFKINSRNKRNYLMTTILLDQDLKELKRSRLSIPMDDRYDFLNEFHLDNEGDLVFSRFNRNTSDNITDAYLMVKPALADSLMVKELNIEKNWLDEIHIKIDNYNKRYFLTSFYYKERRGNIDGFYFYVWDKAAGTVINELKTVFTDELRKEAKGDANLKMAFNDYFIRHIIPRRDGGIIIGSEAFYTSSRFSNSWNRWDYLYGSPYLSSTLNNSYYYSPLYSNYWWSNRWNSNQAVRYHADNISIFSFDKNGKLEWSNVVGKEQWDDESDDMLSYQLMVTSGQLHVLFNKQERRNNLLNDYSITPEGKMINNPTLKHLDKGYDFMPKYAKQVSARQIIVPCAFRNYICFAKIDYN